MNILLLTPLYKIKGRDSFERNTEAIHYLIKYWNEQQDVQVRVINTYLNPGRNIAFLLKKGELSNYKTDYEYEVDSVPVYMTEVQQIPFQSHLWGFQNKKMLRAVNTVIEKYQFVPDVVIAHFPVRYAPIMENIPCNGPKIAVAHTTDTRICKKKPGFWIPRINKAFDRVYCRSLPINRECRELGLENVADFIIYSGVPYAKEIKQNSCSVMINKKITFLYVGKPIKRKHVDYVINALPCLIGKADFDFLIIGKGTEENSLREQAKMCKIEDRVIFLGSMSRDKVYEYMGKANIFIMPSTQETLGLVYLEAMMHGCITVGTENEGIDGIIKDGENGFLVKQFDQESVTNTINRIVTMSEANISVISQNAVKTALYYNEKDMSLRYLDEVKRVAKETREREFK